MPSSDGPSHDELQGLNQTLDDEREDRPSTIPPNPLLEVTALRRLLGVVRSMRPHQWVKNVFVLAPVVFAKEIFDPVLLLRAAAAFVIFCLLTAAVYTMNDLGDVEADRLHPVKRHRPIASGVVPESWGLPLVISFVGSALFGAWFLGPWFFLVGLGYFSINVAYTRKLKHIAYVDVGCISAGFVLRVVGGGFATQTMVSSYLLGCTLLLALFLGFGKRQHELCSVSRRGRQRVALESYTSAGLNLALMVTGAATVLTYLAYTLDPRTRALFRTDWLWVSTVFVVLGVLRFVNLVRHRPKAESPTQEMLRDGPFVAIMMGWTVLVVWVIYHLQPS